MAKASKRVSALLICGLLTAACHEGPRAPSATVTSSAAKPDQSAGFFPATVDTYGLAVTQTDRDHLAELYALRQIDPCGFVQRQTPGFVDGPAPALHGRTDYSFGYSAEGGVSIGPILHPLGGAGCLVALPATKMGLLLQVLPGDPDRYGDALLTPDPSYPGVLKSTSWGACVFRVGLPLTGLAGAPKSMRDPVVQLTSTDVERPRWNADDTSLCPLAEALAGDIAAYVRDKGVPVHAGRRDTAAKFLTGDPCAAAPELQAVGFTWHDPPAKVQFPTTWRHPGTCQLRLTQADSYPQARSAVVKYGLVIWSDETVTGIADQTPGRAIVRSEHDGMTLFEVTGGNETGCYSDVVAKTYSAIEPVTVGTGAPGLRPATPVVTVHLSGPAGSDCGETARQTAVAAVKRAA